MRKFLISCGCNGLFRGKRVSIGKWGECLQGCVSVERQSAKRIYRMDCRLDTYNATQYNFGIKTNLFNEEKNCLLSLLLCEE